MARVPSTLVFVVVPLVVPSAYTLNTSLAKPPTPTLFTTTLPPLSTRARSFAAAMPPVLITQSAASLVPIQLVPATVP